MRTNLIVVCLALCGLMGCAAAVRTTEPAPESIPEMAKYVGHVGKDYWVESYAASLLFCPGVSGRGCYEFLRPGAHLKITELVPNQSPDGRPIFAPSYHVTLDDGRSGYITADVSTTALTDVDPAAAAAECKRLGDPRVGMAVKQLEATCWGKPLNINRKESRNGVHEQYVYGDGRFVYLHNGVVTEVQIRNAGRQR